MFIRLAEEADLDAIVRLIRDAGVFGFPRKVAYREALKQDCLFVAVDSGVCGMVYCYHRRDKTTVVREIAAKNHRQGIGTLLMEHIEKLAKSVGSTRLRLKCPRNNSALYFYDKIGFRTVGEYTGKHVMLDILEKEL